MNGLPTIDQAVDELGLEVPRSRKLTCPTGTDSDPSLHVYEDAFYCFHCGASGDGIGLIALYTNQDVRRLVAQRSSGDRTRMRSATKGMRRGDVAKATYRMYQTILAAWFRFLHEAWADAPMWAFEQTLDLWSQVFDDVRDRILGHSLYTEDDALSPYEAEQLLTQLEGNLDASRDRECAEANRARGNEAQRRYMQRRRALIPHAT